MSISTRDSGIFLTGAGVLVILGSVPVYMLAWTEQWSALYVILGVLITGAGATAVGFGIPKLMK